MPRINITAWNSQGSGVSVTRGPLANYNDTWEILIDRYISALCQNQAVSSAHYVLGMLTEAGTPPSYTNGARLANGAMLDGTIASSAFDVRYRWYGWTKTRNGNLRCSLAALQGYPKAGTPATYPFCDFLNPISLAAIPGVRSLNTRPAAGSLFLRATTTSAVPFNLIVIVVHLPSGDRLRNLNIKILQGLCAHLVSIYPHVPIIVLGDMNINIYGLSNDDVMNELNISGAWILLRSGDATQISGGELDWAITYGCQPYTPTIEIIGALKLFHDFRGIGYIAQGVSDHAMMNYTLDI